jgi:hypothetical protein
LIWKELRWLAPNGRCQKEKLVQGDVLIPPLDVGD